MRPCVVEARIAGLAASEGEVSAEDRTAASHLEQSARRKGEPQINNRLPDQKPCNATKGGLLSSPRSALTAAIPVENPYCSCKLTTLLQL